MISTILLVAVLTAPPQAPPAKAEPLGASVTSLYRSIRRNLVGAAEKMPEEHYGFRPSPDVRTFGEIIGHVANTQYNFCAPPLKEQNPNRANLETTLKTKADLVKALSDALAFCDKAYESLSDEGLHAEVKWGPRPIASGYALVFNIAHANEHYGNLVTYLRIKGIVPPSSERQ
jgi:uncharacterized damage-inducible protein DinB